MDNLDERIINEGIRLPQIIETIKTEKDGGYSGKVSWPESALAQVKQLMGSENKMAYLCVLLPLEAIESVKRSPGRPKKEE